MTASTWTCEYCCTVYDSAAKYTNCRCVGMSAFISGLAMRKSNDEHKAAQAEARERGMAFIVDGKHVNADRVFILSVPDTVGPISTMRREKQDGRRLLQEMEAFQANVSRPLSKQHIALTGRHLSQLMDACGLEKNPLWDDTYLGMHSYITMVDIEAKVREMAQELHDVKSTYTAWKDEHKGQPVDTYSSIAGAFDDAFNRMDLRFDGAIELMNKRGESMQRINHMLGGGGGGPDTSVDESCKYTEAGVEMFLTRLMDARADSQRIDWFDKQRDVLPRGYWWSITADSGITNVRLAMDSNGALGHVVQGDTTVPGLNAVAPLVIDGIVVTDPELAAPITDSMPGMTCACGICGLPFSDDSTSLFCATHRE